MTYADFKDYVKEHILEYLPDEYANAEVIISSNKKNNGLLLDGLNILKPESNICPSIYLNGYYDDYCSERKPIETLLEEIAESRVEHECDLSENNLCFTRFDEMKDKIVFRVVNAEYNTGLLAETPHKAMDNLAITYAISVSVDEQTKGTVRITNNLMKEWGVNQEQLHEVAMKNTPELFPPKFSSMLEQLAEMMEMPEDLIEVMQGDKPQAYVLTNQEGCLGANVLFYPGMMEELGKELGSNYVVLPSSIHEVLIMPETPDMSKEALIAMVKEVNETQVAPEEVLADTAYFYDRTTGVFYDLANEETRDKAVQQNMEYLEKVAADYYNKNAEHPTPEGKEVFWEEIKERVQEKGYYDTLGDLKDKQSELEKSENKELNQEVDSPKVDYAAMFH